MRSALVFLMIVVGSIVAAVLMLRLARRAFPHVLGDEDHQVAGHFLGTVAGLYGVLLAFVVVIVWGQFQEANLIVTREANQLGDLFRLARGFPEPIQTEMRNTLIEYSRTVITTEWPEMAARRESNKGWEVLDAIWSVYTRLEPQTPAQQSLQQLSLSRLAELSDARRLRLLSARSKIPGALWVVLDSGATLTISFTMLFRLRHTLAQTLMTASMTGLIALILFLIWDFDRPFDGAVRVKPEVFERELQRMGVSVTK